MKCGPYFASLIALTALSIPASAHHSFAMFDNSKPIILEGTVKEFQWANPHVFVQLLVKNPKSKKVEEWALEGGATSAMARHGWSRKTIKAGDVIKVDIYRLRSGAKGGALNKALVAGIWVG
jgi:Family of unknown function (DUF6152)